MPATDQDVWVWKGNSYELLFTITNQDGTTPDLNGSSIEWWMSKTPFSTGNNVIIQKYSSNSDITINVSNASFVVAIQAADTANTRPDTYYHEARVTLSNGYISTVATGDFTLVPSIIT